MCRVYEKTDEAGEQGVSEEKYLTLCSRKNTSLSRKENRDKEEVVLEYKKVFHAFILTSE